MGHFILRISQSYQVWDDRPPLLPGPRLPPPLSPSPEHSPGEILWSVQTRLQQTSLRSFRDLQSLSRDYGCANYSTNNGSSNNGCSNNSCSNNGSSNNSCSNNCNRLRSFW